MRAGVAAGQAEGLIPVQTDGGLEAARAAMAADKSLQFAIQTAAPPPPPKVPGWLEAIGRLFSALEPLLTLLFWGVLAAAVAGIAWLVVRELIRIRLPEKKPPRPKPEAWRPAPAQALALLSDADALAEQGRFEEAVHLILLRSIGDIDGKLPNVVRPALTARDIGALSRLPDSARPAFGKIARVVEASLFGGRTVDRDGYLDCRGAYEAFAFPANWTAA